MTKPARKCQACVKMLDVLIIGGGPAGLSAALILGRACREVMVLDTMEPRNAVSPRMHGYPSRDGMPPLDFLECCRDELRTYRNVTWRHAEATDCRAIDGGFETQIAGNESVRSRLLLLASGMSDTIPNISGLQECYGYTAHHCPYCDGWEHRGKRLVAYGQTAEAIEFAVELTGWSSDVTLCTNGITFDDRERERLRRRKIQFVADRITEITSEARRIQSVQFSGGKSMECDAFFFQSQPRQRNDFARSLGCAMDDEDCLQAKPTGETNIRGVFVAGNAKRGLHMVIMAAAEGARAAFAMNERLLGI
jgi:thioredoxin reductase